MTGRAARLQRCGASPHPRLPRVPEPQDHGPHLENVGGDEHSFERFQKKREAGGGGGGGTLKSFFSRVKPGDEGDGAGDAGRAAAPAGGAKAKNNVIADSDDDDDDAGGSAAASGPARPAAVEEDASDETLRDAHAAVHGGGAATDAADGKVDGVLYPSGNAYLSALDADGHAGVFKQVRRTVDNLSERRAFQAGAKRVAIISAAGSVGISLHAGALLLALRCVGTSHPVPLSLTPHPPSPAPPPPASRPRVPQPAAPRARDA